MVPLPYQPNILHDHFIFKRCHIMENSAIHRYLNDTKFENISSNSPCTYGSYLKVAMIPNQQTHRLLFIQSTNPKFALYCIVPWSWHVMQKTKDSSIRHSHRIVHQSLGQCRLFLINNWFHCKQHSHYSISSLNQVLTKVGVYVYTIQRSIGNVSITCARFLRQWNKTQKEDFKKILQIQK